MKNARSSLAVMCPEGLKAEGVVTFLCRLRSAGAHHW